MAHIHTLFLILTTFWCVVSKKSFIDSLSDINEVLALQELAQNRSIIELPKETCEITYDELIDFFSPQTYDGPLLNIFQGILSANFSAYPSFLSSSRSTNSNFSALRYFVHVLSMIVDGVEDPYMYTNMDSKVERDEEIDRFEKLDYTALLEFWKEFMWYDKSMTQGNKTEIRNEFLAFLSTISHRLDSSKDHYFDDLLPLEQKWGIKEAINKSYLNVAKKGRDFFYSKNALHTYNFGLVFNEENKPYGIEKYFKSKRDHINASFDYFQHKVCLDALSLRTSQAPSQI
jgi:hypothetical protein